MRIPLIFTGIAIFFIAAITYFSACYVRGTEINTRTWQVREFSFRRDPFTNHQFTGVYYSTSYLGSTVWAPNAADTAMDLDPAISKYLTPSPGFPNRWDLINIQEHTSSSGDASILTDLLSIYDRSYNHFWIDWTKKHPKLAQVLWPAAHDLAGYNMYSKLPDLFEIAANKLPASEFKTATRNIVHDALAEYCKSNPNAANLRSAATTALSYGKNDYFEGLVDSLPDSL